MLKAGTLVQMHYTDLDFAVKNHNPFEKLKKSKVLDKIVIIAPAWQKNEILCSFARDQGVEIFFGDVDNIVSRMVHD